MSVIKFELKQEHLDLLKNLRWSLLDGKFLVSTEDHENDTAPFGADDIYEAIDLILNGRPTDFNPIEMEKITVYTNEEKETWDNLLAELPTALEIILYCGTFELGTYKARYHDRLWKRINNNL
jgi:hypothetical protein